MSRVIGIDLGTTNTAVAILENGRPRVLEDERGYRVLPSVVSAKGGGRFIVGQAAHNLIITNPDRTVYATKRLIGRHFDSPEVQRVLQRVQYRLQPAPDGGVMIAVGDQWMSPTEVAAVILQVAKSIAERAIGEAVEEAVITVPAYFNHSQRKATLEAAEQAGLRCERILNEPTAAALAYGHRKNIERTLLIFDLGGGTFDVSVLRLSSGIFETLATSGDTFLGGEDFDYRIVDWLADQFQARTNVDPRKDRTGLQRLKDAAERAKCELSFSDRANLVIPHLSGTDGIDTVLTRTTLETLTQDLIDRCVDITRRAVADAGLSIGDIEDVILVGGQTRMPKVRDMVTGVFGKDPNRSVHPEEVVAIGAAVHAASLEDVEAPAAVLLDVTPFDLGIDTAGGMFVPVIPRNSRVPAAETRTFATVVDNQAAVRVTVRQGDHRTTHQNEFLGEFVMEGLTPLPRLENKVEVTFRIDTNGVLAVAATEKKSGEKKNIVIRNYAEHARSPQFPDAEQAKADEAARRKRAAAGAEVEAKAAAVAAAVDTKAAKPKKAGLVDRLLGRAGRKEKPPVPAVAATAPAAAADAAAVAAATAAAAAAVAAELDAEPEVVEVGADALQDLEVTPEDGLGIDALVEVAPEDDGGARISSLSSLDDLVDDELAGAPSMGLAGGPRLGAAHRFDDDQPTNTGGQPEGDPFALDESAAGLSLADLFGDDPALADVELLGASPAAPGFGPSEPPTFARPEPPTFGVPAAPALAEPAPPALLENEWEVPEDPGSLEDWVGDLGVDFDPNATIAPLGAADEHLLPSVVDEGSDTVGPPVYAAEAPAVGAGEAPVVLPEADEPSVAGAWAEISPPRPVVEALPPPPPPSPVLVTADEPSLPEPAPFAAVAVASVATLGARLPTLAPLPVEDEPRSDAADALAPLAGPGDEDFDPYAASLDAQPPADPFAQMAEEEPEPVAEAEVDPGWRDPDSSVVPMPSASGATFPRPTRIEAAPPETYDDGFPEWGADPASVPVRLRVPAPSAREPEADELSEPSLPAAFVNVRPRGSAPQLPAPLPGADEPAADEPVADAPAADEPAADAPAAEGTPDEPAADEVFADPPLEDLPIEELPEALAEVDLAPLAEEPLAEEPLPDELPPEAPLAEAPVAEEAQAEALPEDGAPAEDPFAEAASAEAAPAEPDAWIPTPRADPADWTEPGAWALPDPEPTHSGLDEVAPALGEDAPSEPSRPERTASQLRSIADPGDFDAGITMPAVGGFDEELQELPLDDDEITHPDSLTDVLPELTSDPEVEGLGAVDPQNAPEPAPEPEALASPAPVDDAGDSVSDIAPPDDWTETPTAAGAEPTPSLAQDPTGFALLDADGRPAAGSGWRAPDPTPESAGWSLADFRSDAHTRPGDEPVPAPRPARKPARVKVHYRDVPSLVTEYRDALRRGGTFIRTERPLPVGRECLYEVAAPGLAEPIVVPARVTFVTTAGPGQEAGMAVEYDLSDPDRERLERTLERL